MSTKRSNELPTTIEFFDFLRDRCHYLEDVEVPNTNISQYKQLTSFNPNTTPKKFSSYVGTSANCQLCKDLDHAIYACPEFIRASVSQRQNKVRALRLCYNCLSPEHQVKGCRSGPCRKCQKRHNTMLHAESGNAEANCDRTRAVNPVRNQESAYVSTTASAQAPSAPVTVLATAIVNVKDRYGQNKQLRVLLDSGSQINFMTEAASKMLGHKITKVKYPVSGIANTSTSITKRMEATIYSLYNSYQSRLQFSLVPKITENLPHTNINPYPLNIPKTIQLADPDFQTSAKIDLLIGAEIYGDLLCVGQIRNNRNSPVLQKTQLGWIIYGKVPAVGGQDGEKVICRKTSSGLRSKWNQSGTAIKVGGMVLLIDENLPPQRWSIGRVVELHPGSDGFVRVVSVKTHKNTVRRAVKRLCVVPIDV